MYEYVHTFVEQNNKNWHTQNKLNLQLYTEKGPLNNIPDRIVSFIKCDELFCVKIKFHFFPKYIPNDIVNTAVSSGLLLSY